MNNKTEENRFDFLKEKQMELSPEEQEIVRKFDLRMANAAKKLASDSEFIDNFLTMPNDFLNKLLEKNPAYGEIDTKTNKERYLSFYMYHKLIGSSPKTVTDFDFEFSVANFFEQFAKDNGININPED